MNQPEDNHSGKTYSKEEQEKEAEKNQDVVFDEAGHKVSDSSGH